MAVAEKQRFPRLWHKAAAPIIPSPAFAALVAQLREVADGLEDGRHPFIAPSIPAEDDDDRWSRHHRDRLALSTVSGQH
jgi:hypothetical protein